MEKKEYTSPYDFEGKIPLKQAIILGLQHVLAMFVGNLTPVLIITGACAATHDADVFAAIQVSLLQNAMLIGWGRFRIWCHHGSKYYWWFI